MEEATVERKAKKRKGSIFDMFRDEILEAVQRGVPFTRIIKDINEQLPEGISMTHTGLYRYSKRNGII